MQTVPGPDDFEPVLAAPEEGQADRRRPTGPKASGRKERQPNQPTVPTRRTSPDAAERTKDAIAEGTTSGHGGSSGRAPRGVRRNIEGLSELTAVRAGGPQAGRAPGAAGREPRAGAGWCADEAGRAALKRLRPLGGALGRRTGGAPALVARGETSAAIAARLGVRAEQVRRWRRGPRGRRRCGRVRGRGGRHASARRRSPSPATSLRGSAADRPVWTLARLAAEVAARTGETISSGHLSVVLRKGATAGGGRGTRSRDARTADAVDALGLRLRLLKQQAAAGDIHLLFGDEAEALTHPYLAHCWAERGADLRVEAPGRAKRRALLGVLDHARGELVVITSGTKRSGDFADLLARLDRSYAPRPGRASRPVVLVLDNGPIHTSRASRRPAGRRAAWLSGRVAPEVRPGAERHRALLARPEERHYRDPADRPRSLRTSPTPPADQGRHRESRRARRVKRPGASGKVRGTSRD